MMTNREERPSTFVMVGIAVAIAGIAIGLIVERGFTLAIVPIVVAGAMLWGVIWIGGFQIGAALANWLESVGGNDPSKSRHADLFDGSGLRSRASNAYLTDDGWFWVATAANSMALAFQAVALWQARHTVQGGGLLKSSSAVGAPVAGAATYGKCTTIILLGMA